MDKLDKQISNLKRMMELRDRIKFFQNVYNRNGTGYKFLESLKNELRELANEI